MRPTLPRSPFSLRPSSRGGACTPYALVNPERQTVGGVISVAPG